MNNITLIGRLTKDVDLRYTNSQMAVSTFTLAIDRPVKQGEEKKADFPRVTVFGKQAENMEKYVGKGCRIAVQGRIQTGSYKDKDGKTVYTTDVVANRVEFIDFKDKDNQSAPQHDTDGGMEPPEGFQHLSDDDIPF